MSGPRRRRYTVKNPVQIGLNVELSSHERLSQLAEKVGASRSAMIDFLIKTVPLDDAGVPLAWPKEQEPDVEPELPMTG